MGRTEVTAVSIRESEVKRCAKLVRDNVSSGGISVEYGSSVRHIPSDVVSRVSNEEETENKYKWVDSIEDHVINGAAQWDHSLYSWRIVVDEYRQQTESCIDRKSVPRNVRLSLRDIGGKTSEGDSKQISKYAPFSYDPQQDYKTEQ